MSLERLTYLLHISYYLSDHKTNKTKASKEKKITKTITFITKLMSIKLLLELKLMAI